MSGKITISGPMFAPAKDEYWQSVHRKEGAHYNTFAAADASGRDCDGLPGLRALFPKGEADEYNLVLFSTSGVHGMYTTIEEAEEARLNGGSAEEDEEDGSPYFPAVTFLVVHPRIVCLRYGNCEPVTPDDFAFLKRLRSSSWKWLSKIGAGA